MPNWCNNTVQIKGPAKKIQAIKKAMEAGKFLNHLFPMPKELEGTTADGSENQTLIKKTGYSDWYGWCTNEWGTKWEISEGYPEEPEIADWGKDEKTLSWSFDSAWAPPIGAYAHYLDNNDDVSIFATYYEPGCDFAGVWENGDDRGFTISDYDSNDDFWTTDDDGILLDDNFGIVESKAEWEAEQREQEEDVTEYVKGNARNLDKLHIGEEK
jgi:hypothetical protein